MDEIIGTHIIKPSSPTPAEFKIHKLSSLDQISAPVYIPLIFFYQNDQSKPHKEISQCLRETLSRILTIFYPLSGIVKENSFIDCNDTGTKLVEARVHAGLEQFIQHHKLEELKKLIPVDNLPHCDSDILLVKASYFDCGGVAVGVCLSHKIGDASSFVSFMNAWAATSRGEVSRIIHPSFDLALHFPPGDLSSTTAGITTQKMVRKRIVFEKLKKEVAASSDEVKDPTTVEALSVLIWRSFIEAEKAKYSSGMMGTTASFVATHAVDLRRRIVPPIPNHTFGNCMMLTSAVVSSEEDERESGVHVHISRLRAAIRAMDGDYINNVIECGDRSFQALDKFGDLLKGGNCFLTSWWRFPMYDVDFGWGKPVWVCTTTLPYTNTVILMSTPSGDGIEACINASDEDFFKLLQLMYK